MFFLSSKYAKSIIASNSYLDFTTKLSKEVVLPRFNEDGSEISWTMALTDFNFTHSPTNEEFMWDCPTWSYVTSKRIRPRLLEHTFLIL